MVEFDKDVHDALETLERKGFETYAVGNCIIVWTKGMSPVDWDLVTKAPTEEILRLFPDGTLIDDKKGVVRLDFTRETQDAAGDTTIEGSVCDITTMSGTIEEELSGYGFTLAAIADNPEKTIIDPYGGLKDIENNQIRAIGDPDGSFKAEPVIMMQAMRYVSDFGFDLQKGIYDAMLKNRGSLLDHDVEPIRDELELIMAGNYVGKALKLMDSTGLLAAVLGDDVVKNITPEEKQKFSALCENIDKTMPLRMRRLGLLYTILDEKRGLEAINRMNYDMTTETHLKDAMHEMIKIQFLDSDTEFKRYLYEHGLNRYNYVHNLSKAQRIVYGLPATKIEARNNMMCQIKENNEAVFIEDLVIDGNDIMEAGIADSQEEAEELLHLIIAKVHQDARNNDVNYLLKMAKHYSRHRSKTNSKSAHRRK